MDDRISTLPDEILHHILSFLAAEEAVATSALSKRWRPLWLSLTTLTLKPRNVEEEEEEEDEDIDEDIDKDYYFYLQTLRIVDVPRSIFSCRALVVLRLRERFVKNFHNIDFPLLKTLHLKKVFFSENRCLVDLFNGCPNLEHLEAHDVFLERGSFDEGEYNCLLPKLVSASVSATCHPNIPLTALSNVEFLRVEQRDDHQELPVFPNLTHLKLILPLRTISPLSWSLVFNFLKKCPKLQNLLVDMLGQMNPLVDDAAWFENSVSVEIFHYLITVPECLCSQFRNCTLTNYCGEKNEKQFAEYIMKNSSSLQTMRIQCLPSLDPAEKLKMLKELSLCPRRSAASVVFN